MGQLCSGTVPVGFSSARTALSCAASLPWGGCTAFGYLQAYKANNAMKLRQQSSPPFSSSEPSRGNAPTLKKKKKRRGKKKQYCHREHRGRFQERSTATTNAAFIECLLFQHKGRTPGGSAHTAGPRGAEPTALLSLVRAPPLPPRAVALCPQHEAHRGVKEEQRGGQTWGSPQGCISVRKKKTKTKSAQSREVGES